MILKLCSEDLWGAPETLSGGRKIKTTVIIILRLYLQRFTLVLQVYSEVFQRSHEGHMNAEADMKIQLSSFKPDIRDSQKHKTLPVLLNLL